MHAAGETIHTNEDTPLAEFIIKKLCIHIPVFLILLLLGEEEPTEIVHCYPKRNYAKKQTPEYLAIVEFFIFVGVNQKGS